MCDCIKTLNATLAEHNAVVDAPMMMNMKTGKTRIAWRIPLLKLNKSRKALPVLVAQFCPQCGEATAK